jgi:T5SS/PEP-CTERM-associated repeat protein
MRATVLRSAVVATALLCCLDARGFIFTQVASSGTSDPGGQGVLRFPAAPVIDQDVVGFYARTSLDGQGLYGFSGGQLVKLVDNATAAPGGTGATFSDFHALSLDTGGLAFVASTAQGGTFVQRGVYQMSFPTTGPIAPVAEKGTLTPAGLFKGDAKSTSAAGGAIAFQGSTEGTTSVLFLRQPGASDLTIIAKNGDLLPGSTGPLSSIATAHAGGDGMVVQGNAGGFAGIWSWSADQGFTLVAGSATPLPGAPSGWYRLESGPVIDDDGTVAFASVNGSGGSWRGVYVKETGGAIEGITAAGGPDPSVPGVFAERSVVSLDRGNVLFIGSEYLMVNGAPRLTTGLYTTLGATPGDPLQRVVGIGDFLDGKEVRELDISQQAISGTAMAFHASFTDGTWAVYRADSPFRWLTPGGGSFEDGANWQPGLAPGAADQALFDLPGSYAVTLSEPRVAGSLRIQSALGNDILVELTGSGRLDVRNVQVAGGRLALNALNLKVGSADLDAAEQVIVQLHVRERLELQDESQLTGGIQGFVDGPGDAAPAIVASGVNSTLSFLDFVVGATQSGELSVRDGAELQAKVLFTVGRNVGATGSVDVRGRVLPDGASAWVPARIMTNTLQLGEGGNAVMTVDAGAQVGSDLTRLGILPGSNGKLIVTGEHTALLGAEDFAHMEVGVQGIGELIVSDKARVVSTMDVGLLTGAVGAVLVTGAGTTLESGELNVGLAGAGSVVVRDGATFTGTVVDIGLFSNGNGTIVVEGAGTKMLVEDQILISEFGVAEHASLIVRNSAAVEMPSTGTLEVGNGGVLELHNGASFTAGAAAVAFSGKVIGNNSTFSIPEGALFNDGTVQIGQSPGTFTIDGGYQQGANGVLEIEIAGDVPGIDYDVLSVTGDAILDGTLQLVFLDAFIPGTQDVFTFLNVGGNLTGRFSAVRTVGLPDAFALGLQSDGRSLALVITAVPEPGAGILLLVGLAALAGINRARRLGSATTA